VWQQGFSEFDTVSQRDIPGTAKQSVRNRHASRFAAAPALIALSKHHGVTPKQAKEHFHFGYSLPKDPLRKRTASTRGAWRHKVTGREMKVERSATTETLENEVRELNEFLKLQEIGNGRHEGYLRRFQNGDHPDFNWDLGGRLYSLPPDGSYQQLSKASRLKMTINSEPVAEIDIRASYLTIFHAAHGQAFSSAEDPYRLPEFGVAGRAIVKSWMVTTFGSAQHIERWPSKMLEDYEKDHGKPLDRRTYTVSRVRDAALAAFPLLRRWGEPRNGRPFTWADLMYQESAVIVATMLSLKRDHGVPSLAVHDSLIVPISQSELAANILRREFKARVGVVPELVGTPRAFETLKAP
jgi:hypothetical protein